MNNTLTIPKSIKAGFQERKDTYSKKLAYVIYTDSKGKLRKENSWNSWISKDIPAEDYDNIPMSGFVLNRNVGGTRRSYSWNARVEKVRVYDPRGFEIEIDIENMLFILEECSSIKGKGLEGEFIYSWNGPCLVLLPTSSQEYIESTKFNVLQTEKVTAADMVVGSSYLTKKKDKVIYMGRHIWWGTPTLYRYRSTAKFGVKKHIFAKEVVESETNQYGRESDYLIESGFTNIAQRVTSDPVPQYADIFERMMNSCLLSKPVRLYTTPCKDRDTENKRYYSNSISCIIEQGDTFQFSNVNLNENYTYGQQGRVKGEPYYSTFIYGPIELKNGIISHLYEHRDYRGNGYSGRYTKEQIKSIAKNLMVECENGYKVELIDSEI